MRNQDCKLSDCATCPSGKDKKTEFGVIKCPLKEQLEKANGTKK